jgi:hypothetical protein
MPVIVAYPKPFIPLQNLIRYFCHFHYRNYYGSLTEGSSASQPESGGFFVIYISMVRTVYLV